jgi:PD-(D/E)XK nuclease superfamily/Domain of unknown function (DUF2357)
LAVILKRRDHADVIVPAPGNAEICVRENELVVIEVETDGGVPSVFLDGASVGHPLVRKSAALWIWTWSFSSESWCGHSSISIETGQGAVELDILSTPDGSKLTWREYREMFERIVEYGSQLPWGLAPGMETAAQGPTGGIRATHPALLEAYLSELLARLLRILADPVRRLQPKPVLDKFLPTRPTNGQTVAWLSAHPVQRERLRLGDLTVAIRQQVQEETFDHPANRHVIGLLRRLARSLVGSRKAFTDFAENGWKGTLERNRAQYLAGKISQAEREIKRVVDASIFRNLTPGDLTETVAQVFADHPAYGSFARVARLLLGAQFVISDEGALEASLRRTYDLFEIYCLYKISRDLQDALSPEWTFAVRPARQGSLMVELAAGVFWTASHPDGRRWELRYQQTFASNNEKSEFFSLTRERRPDYVLAAFAGNHLIRWVLLDAKYRVDPGAILDALADMHVYRDSLRWRVSTGTEPTTCNAGYLIVPAISAKCESYEAVDYRQRWGLGLIRANDTNSISRLVAHINW